MIQQAKVASIEALEEFRSSLIVYLSKARPALEDMSDDVRQTRIWLEEERRSYWENAVRLRTRDLNQAQQELFSSRISSLKEPTSTQQRAVTHAKHALTEAEDKLRLVRKWCRDYENLTGPLAKQLEQTHSFLAIDMRHAVDSLAQIVSKLDAYADKASPAVSSISNLPSEAASSPNEANIGDRENASSKQEISGD
jgi:hypothetical protein